MILLKATAYLVIQKDVKSNKRALQAACCISVSVSKVSPMGSTWIGGSTKMVLPSLGSFFLFME